MRNIITVTILNYDEMDKIGAIPWMEEALVNKGIIPFPGASINDAGETEYSVEITGTGITRSNVVELLAVHGFEIKEEEAWQAEMSR